MQSDTVIVKLPYCLPDEIWLSVFEWATLVPNAFEVHAPDPFAELGSRSQKTIQGELGGSMRTIRSLVLVCRAWNLLATQFLYRSIMIAETTSLKQLLSSLKGETASDRHPCATETYRSWAHRCIRLDMSMSFRSLPLEEFTELLGSLKSLQIIVVRGMYPTLEPSGSFDSFFQALWGLKTRSLHVIDIVAPNNDYLSIDLRAVECQPLRVLRIRMQGIASKNNTNVSFPSIEYLDVPRKLLEQVLTDNTVPCSLFHLSLHSMRGHGDTAATQVLAGIGHQLTSLEIEDGTWFTLPPADAEEFMRVLQRLADFCPNLRTLVIGIISSRLHDVNFPPIENLGVRIPITTVGKHDYERCRWLCNYLSRVILQCRTVERSDLSTNQEENFLSDYGVRFEDEKGQLLYEIKEVDGKHKRNDPYEGPVAYLD